MPLLPWIGIVFLLLAFLEHQTKRPLEIGFDRDRVVINTLIRQQHDWSVFNNVLLRDGLLTLDFKNNRLLQKEIADDDAEDDDVDEEEFNAYCRDRLTLRLNLEFAELEQIHEFCRHYFEINAIVAIHFILRRKRKYLRRHFTLCDWP